MRIVVVDSDKAFVTSLSARCQKASVFCQVIAAPASAFAEIKKNPDAVDLVLISKELAGADGLTVAQMLRKDPKTVDVPYVLMSSAWGKAEFAKHQKTEFGANAYFNKKSALAELEATIEAVTGFKFGGGGAAAAAPVNAPSNGNTGSMLNIKLEAASDVVNISEDVPSDISMSEPISLFGDEASAPAPEPKKPATPTISAAPPKISAPSPKTEPATNSIQLNVATSTGLTAPAKKPAVISVQATGAIDIMAAPKAPDGPPAAAIAVSSEAAIEAAAPVVEGSLFSIDLAAGTEPEGVSPPAPKAAGPKAPPKAPPAPEPEAVAAPSIELAAPAIDAVAPALELGNSVAQPPAAADSGGGGIEISLGMDAAVVEAPIVASTAPPEPVVAETPSVSSIDLGALSVADSAPVAEVAAPVIAAASLDSLSIADSISLPDAEIAPAVVAPVVAEAAADFSLPDAIVPPAPEPAMIAPVAEAPPPAPAAPTSVSEEEAAQDLPYLFAGGAASIAPSSTTFTKSMAPAQQMAQGPSSRQLSEMGSTGGGSNEDVETLKKYLTMREQDVSVLTAQLSYAKEELGKCENTIKRLNLQGEDLFHQINDLKQKNTTLEQELSHASKNREGEVDQLRFEVKAKIDRIKFLEDRLNDSAQQYEKLKERVRLDIRKIRIREKELESKLEILKKDSETLIAGRENKILELKRKIDLLEFNYDTLQDKNDMEKQNVVKGNEKIDRVLKVLKLAVGVIEAEGEQSGESKNELGGGPGPRAGEKVA